MTVGRGERGGRKGRNGSIIGIRARNAPCGQSIRVAASGLGSLLCEGLPHDNPNQAHLIHMRHQAGANSPFLVVRFFGSRSAKRSGSVRQSMIQRPDSGDTLTSLALNFLFLPLEPPPTPGSRREGSQGDEKAISCQKQQSARSPLRTRAVRTKSSTGCPVIATVNRLPKGTSGDDRGVRQTPRVEVIFGITPPSISAQIPFSFGHFGSTMEVFD